MSSQPQLLGQLLGSFGKDKASQETVQKLAAEAKITGRTRDKEKDIQDYNTTMDKFGKDAKKATYKTGDIINKRDRVVEILEMTPGDNKNEKGEYRVQITQQSANKDGNYEVWSDDHVTPAKDIDDWAKKAFGGSTRRKLFRRCKKRKSRRRRTTRKR
jgi:hypothetical protein